MELQGVQMSKESDEIVETMVMVQRVVDNYYYMFECITGALNELDKGNTNNAKSLLSSAKNSAIVIIRRNKMMSPELRKKKMEQIP